jgi:hypothetical protein
MACRTLLQQITPARIASRQPPPVPLTRSETLPTSSLTTRENWSISHLLDKKISEQNASISPQIFAGILPAG